MLLSDGGKLLIALKYRAKFLFILIDQSNIFLKSILLFFARFKSGRVLQLIIDQKMFKKFWRKPDQTIYIT